MGINYALSFVATLFTTAGSVLAILIHFHLALPYLIYVPLLLAAGLTVYALAFGVRNPITLIIIFGVLVGLLEGFLVIGWYGFGLLPGVQSQTGY